MFSPAKSLEKQIAELGNALADPSISVTKLLTLFDIPYRAKEVCYGMKQDIEDCLSRVNTYPNKSIKSAISTLSGSLVRGKLFKHANNDVRVAVASCISDIIRIYAPDLPYDLKRMNEVFLLVVSSFENLSDNSSRSYAKRCHILKIVAGCKLGVIMLNLECHVQILDMFDHFFKEIRDHHPDNVFSSMGTIMTQVIEGGENVSSELVSTLLDAVKDDEVSTIVKKLGEKVIENCNSKLKPYFARALNSLGRVSSIQTSIFGAAVGYSDDQNRLHLPKVNTKPVIGSAIAAKKRGRDETKECMQPKPKASAVHCLVQTSIPPRATSVTCRETCPRQRTEAPKAAPLAMPVTKAEPSSGVPPLGNARQFMPLYASGLARRAKELEEENRALKASGADPLLPKKLEDALRTQELLQKKLSLAEKAQSSAEAQLKAELDKRVKNEQKAITLGRRLQQALHTLKQSQEEVTTARNLAFSTAADKAATKPKGLSGQTVLFQRSSIDKGTLRSTADDRLYTRSEFRAMIDEGVAAGIAAERERLISDVTAAVQGSLWKSN